MQVVRYKRCTKCGEYRSLDRFSPHPRMADGRQPACKVCGAAAAREWRRKNREKQREQSRRKYERIRAERPQDHRARIARWRAQNADHAKAQARAHLAVLRATRSGEMVRPDYCSACGAHGPIEGHHEDYSKPLDVWWLCRLCHRAADAQRQKASSDPT